MEFIDIQWSRRVEVFLRPKHDPKNPYEAHLTGDGVQLRGKGGSPREAIIDALSEETA